MYHHHHHQYNTTNNTNNTIPITPNTTSTNTISTTDPTTSYYNHAMTDPTYAAYINQYYAAYGLPVPNAYTQAMPTCTFPPNLDLDSVILKSESTRKSTNNNNLSAPSNSSNINTTNTIQSKIIIPTATTTTTTSNTVTTIKDTNPLSHPISDASSPSTLLKSSVKRKPTDMINESDDTTLHQDSDSNDSAHVKKKKMIRYAAGKVWEDKSLIEWPENDFRLFVGDLGPEVVTQTLEQAFGKYVSFQKAHVVRDPKTGKSKGYGFVSFMNADDYTKAFREYNNKYIGSRPVKLRKSAWQDRNVEKKKEKLKRIFG